MEKKFVKYIHHGKEVSVREDLKGTHRDVCLCYNCSKFKIDDGDEHCKIADLLYAVDVITGLVTPVFECPEFVEGAPYEFKTETGQA